jgi:hypothetical protein
MGETPSMLAARTSSSVSFGLTGPADKTHVVGCEAVTEHQMQVFALATSEKVTNLARGGQVLCRRLRRAARLFQNLAHGRLPVLSPRWKDAVKLVLMLAKTFLQPRIRARVCALQRNAAGRTTAPK